MTLSSPDRPLALVGYTIFFACVICGNRLGGLLGTRGALVLGEASFGIYMLHGVLLNVAFVGGASLMAAVPAAARPWLLVPMIPIMAGIAFAIYLLVERQAPGVRDVPRRRSARTVLGVDWSGSETTQTGLSTASGK